MSAPLYAPRLSATYTPRIFSGRIARVDASSGTVDVQVDGIEGRYYSHCEIVSPIKAAALGGIDHLPRVGDACVMLENTSHRGHEYAAAGLVIGYRSMNSTALSSRVELFPGDIRIQGATGSDVLLRNNGDIYVVSDQQTMMAFLSTEEIVRLRSASYEHTLSGGSVRWSVQSAGDSAPVGYLMGIKADAAEAEPYLTVSAGSEGGLNVTLHMAGAARSDAVNPLLINNVEASAGFKFTVSSDGTVGASSASMWTQESVGPMLLTSQTAVSMIAPQLMLGAPGAGGVSFPSSGPMVINAPNGLEINAPFIRLRQSDEQVTLNSDGAEESKQLLNIELLKWLFNHVHVVMPATPGQPTATTAPVGTPLGSTTPAAMAIRDGAQAAAAMTPGGPAIAEALNSVITSADSIHTQDTRAR